MPDTSTQKFCCDSCGKQYTWKPELAGKKAKCKCGTVMVVPRELAEPEADADLYDLLPQGNIDESAVPNIPVAPVAVASAQRGSSRSSPSPVLGYRNAPTQRERDRMSNSTLMDMRRDVYVPVTLLIAGFALYVDYYAIHYHLSGAGIGAVTFGVGLMTGIKAVLLIIFALVVAGPLGVSFGGVWTAALKLAAIAVFVDGVTTLVDAGVGAIGAGGGILSSAISFPVILGLYWVLLIYLFSMDSQDSWTVVILLAVFDIIVRTIVMMLLLAMIMGWGGASISVPGAGSGSKLTRSSPVVDHVEQLKEKDWLSEANEYIAGGRQAALTESVKALYAAGARKVWFGVSPDFENKFYADDVIVEMPEGKDKRKKVLDVMPMYYKSLGRAEDEIPATVDDGEPYLVLPLH